MIGDEKLLTQVIINLAKNAVEALAGKEDKLIELSFMKNQQEKTTIRMKDNGKGMPKEVLDKVFVPFYTTKENGSGIGLNFSRQIIHHHNSTINIYSKENEGTTVIIVF